MAQVPREVRLAIAEQVAAENKAISNLRVRTLAAQKKTLVALKRGENSVSVNVNGTINTAIKDAVLMGFRRTVLRIQRATKLKIDVPTTFSLYAQVQEVAKFYPFLDIDAIVDNHTQQGLLALNQANLQFEKQVEVQVGRVLNSGLHVAGQKSKLLEVFEKVGVGKSMRTPGRLETVARTQVSNAYNAARWQAVEKHPDIAEMVWGYKYVAVDDSRVRETHIAQDGVQYPKEHEFWATWWPPNGYNCRCSTIELFKSEKPRVKHPDSAESPDSGFEYNSGDVL